MNSQMAFLVFSVIVNNLAVDVSNEKTKAASLTELF